MNNNKTKNNTSKIELVWPEETFTIKSLQTLNPDVVNITLRFKINQAIADGKIVSIGKNTSTMGRPTLVFASTSVSDKTLFLAKKQGVILDSKFEARTAKVVADFTKDIPKIPTIETDVIAEETYVEETSVV